MVVISLVLIQLKNTEMTTKVRQKKKSTIFEMSLPNFLCKLSIFKNSNLDTKGVKKTFPLAPWLKIIRVILGVICFFKIAKVAV